MDVVNLWKRVCLTYVPSGTFCSVSSLMFLPPLILLLTRFCCILCLVVLHSECPNHEIGGGDAGTFFIAAAAAFVCQHKPRISKNKTGGFNI